MNTHKIVTKTAGGDQFLMPCEAAKIIGITPDGVRVMERTGRLPALKTADGWRIFRRSDVEQAAEQRAARKARRVR